MGYRTGFSKENLGYIGILQEEKFARHLKINMIQATEHKNTIENFEFLPGCMGFHGAPQHSLVRAITLSHGTEGW